MGADLYIKDMDREQQYRGFEVSKEARAAGYFRDAYNGSGLFAVMGATLGVELSWWQTADRPGLFDVNGNMTVDGAIHWRAELAPLVERFCATTELKHRPFDLSESPDVPAEKVPFYHEWARGLIEFLDLAIERKSSIIWSV